MKKREIPYIAHLFVCKKTRDGKRKSCGDDGGGDFKSILKKEVKKRGWKGKIRVSDSGCMGLCEDGPNIILYPQAIWFSAVTEADLPEIIKTLEEIMEE